jgi:hypothetical protein
MFTFIFLAAAIASFGITIFARKKRGYADEYYIPSKQNPMVGTTVQLRSVRYTSVGVGIFFSLATYASYAAYSIEAAMQQL